MMRHSIILAAFAGVLAGCKGELDLAWLELVEIEKRCGTSPGTTSGLGKEGLPFSVRAT
jgi:hypothetical protein